MADRPGRCLEMSSHFIPSPRSWIIFASSSGDHLDCFLAGEAVGSSAVDAARFNECGCGRRLDGDGLALEGGAVGADGVMWGWEWGFALPVTEVAIVDGREGSEVVDLAAGEVEEERPLSSSPSPSPGRASFGLRRSEISTFEDW